MSGKNRSPCLGFSRRLGVLVPNISNEMVPRVLGSQAGMSWPHFTFKHPRWSVVFFKKNDSSDFQRLTLRTPGNPNSPKITPDLGLVLLFPVDWAKGPIRSSPPGPNGPRASSVLEAQLRLAVVLASRRKIIRRRPASGLLVCELGPKQKNGPPKKPDHLGKVPQKNMENTGKTVASPKEMPQNNWKTVGTQACNGGNNPLEQLTLDARLPPATSSCARV